MREAHEEDNTVQQLREVIIINEQSITKHISEINFLKELVLENGRTIDALREEKQHHEAEITMRREKI